jgi:hypothetical protein
MQTVLPFLRELIDGQRRREGVVCILITTASSRTTLDARNHTTHGQSHGELPHDIMNSLAQQSTTKDPPQQESNHMISEDIRIEDMKGIR